MTFECSKFDLTIENTSFSKILILSIIIHIIHRYLFTIKGIIYNKFNIYYEGYYRINFRPT